MQAFTPEHFPADLNGVDVRRLRQLTEDQLRQMCSERNLELPSSAGSPQMVIALQQHRARAGRERRTSDDSGSDSGNSSKKRGGETLAVQLAKKRQTEAEARAAEAEARAAEAKAQQAEAEAQAQAAQARAQHAAASQPPPPPPPPPQPPPPPPPPQDQSPPGSVRLLRKQLRGLKGAQGVERTAAREQQICELEFELEERERKYRKYGQW